MNVIVAKLNFKLVQVRETVGP